MQRFRDANRAVTETSKAVSKRTADVVTSTAGEVQDGAGKALTATGSATGDVLSQLKSMSIDKVFPECPAPPFMLPTGLGVEDYVIVFDLDEITNRLRSGLFVRPKIEVWSGRSGEYDLEHFGQELVQDFLNQYEEARQGLASTYQPGINELDAERDRLSMEVRKEAAGPTLTSAARWALMATVPPVFLLALALGFRPRVKLIGLIGEYLGTRGERRRTQEALDRELKALESRFDSKNRAFARGVKKIEVREHPEIRRIARLIAESGDDDDPRPPLPRGEAPPDIKRYLRHPRYLERLPERYRKLLG